MDLVVYAVPFFILAMLLELAYGLQKGRNTFRLNDSVSSLFLGVLSQARRFVTLGVGGYVYYLVTKKRYFHKPTLATVRQSCEWMRNHALRHGVTCIAMCRDTHS